MDKRTPPAPRSVDVDLSLEDPAQDLRGLRVEDVDGQLIGTVSHLLVDPGSRRVSLLEITLDRPPGDAVAPAVVPLGTIGRIGDDVVRVACTRRRVSASPRQDLELSEEQDLNDLYVYYGLPLPLGPGGDTAFAPPERL